MPKILGQTKPLVFLCRLLALHLLSAKVLLGYIAFRVFWSGGLGSFIRWPVWPWYSYPTWAVAVQAPWLAISLRTWTRHHCSSVRQCYQLGSAHEHSCWLWLLLGRCGQEILLRCKCWLLQAPPSCALTVRLSAVKPHRLPCDPQGVRSE